MQEPDTTKLQIREDRPTGLSSVVHGSNLDAMGFNIAFIALRNPKLAIEIMRLYDEAHKLQSDDPKAPDEDFKLFTETLTALLGNASDNDF
jgi:hypothetical protein